MELQYKINIITEENINLKKEVYVTTISKIHDDVIVCNGCFSFHFINFFSYMVGGNQLLDIQDLIVRITSTLQKILMQSLLS